MDSRRISEMIVKAYGKKYNLEPEVEMRPVWRQELAVRWRAVLPVLADAKFKIIGAAAGVVFLAATIYYYNILLDYEHEMLKSASQVEVLLQRRNDISINLAKAVGDYSSYERQVLTEIVKLRSLLPKDAARGAKPEDPAAAPPKPGNELAGLLKGQDGTAALASLLAVAEQYPDLKLSANFQSLMAALVEVEKDLAGERLKFNEAAMIYWGYVSRFPSNFFAGMFGFKPTPYFTATQEAQTLKPIAY